MMVRKKLGSKLLTLMLISGSAILCTLPLLIPGDNSLHDDTKGTPPIAVTYLLPNAEKTQHPLSEGALAPHNPSLSDTSSVSQEKDIQTKGQASLAMFFLSTTITSTPVFTTDYPCLTGINWSQAILLNIIDGDTIDVLTAEGSVERVRYIGIDTPEIGEPGYEQAKRANAALLTNLLYLVKDVSDRDHYGRLLRYVVSNGKSLSHELVAQGWARLMTLPPNVRCASELVSLLEIAQTLGRGLWAQKQTSTAGKMLATVTLVPPKQQCHPAYPDVCIPFPPPDLDCSDIKYRNFRVVPPDPHRLDKDGDGIGCEE